MNKLEDVEPVEAFELVDEPHQLGGAEPELGLLAATFRPASGPLRVQLDSHAGSRSHAELVGDLKENVDFAELLEDYEHSMAEFLSHESEPHELFVLVPVAHDQVIGVLGQTQHRL